MSGQQPTNNYAFGDCTDYVARRFPGIAQNLGNAKDWITSAKLQGYPILSTPTPDSVVVYGPLQGYSALGHVAVVDSVNTDGTFNVSEMNYGAQNWNAVTQRTSSMTDVLGFIVPPGSSAVYTPGMLQSTGGNSQSPITSWGGINMDPVVGGIAMAAGGFIVLVSVLILTAMTLSRTRVGQAAASTAGMVTGPAGSLVRTVAANDRQRRTVTRTSAQQQAATTQRAAAAQSQERVARAKQRVIVSTAMPENVSAHDRAVIERVSAASVARRQREAEAA